MYRILIVDDERIEREGMHAMLQKGLPGIEIEEASNGIMALETARAFRPDLVFMDIKMPGMSGLETIERMVAEHKGICYVMVTAFDTFDYARQAIKLGVKEYVLKPYRARDIVDIAGKVLDQIGEERKLLEQRRQQQHALERTMPLVETDVVTQLLYDHVHEAHLEELIGLLDIRATGEMFALNVMLPSAAEGLYTAVKEKIRRAGNCWTGAMNGRQIPVIAFCEPGRSFRSQAVSLARDILSVRGFGSEAGGFIGIGHLCDSLQLIRQSYQESLIASMDISLPARFRLYEDVLQERSSAGTASAPLGREREKRLLDYIRLGEWDAVHASVMEMIGCHEREGANLVQAQQRMLELLWVASRMLADMGIEAESPMYTFRAQDFRQLRTETETILERMKQAYDSYFGSLSPDIVYDIKRYIREHSHEDISLETIGARVGLTPFYISKIFKEQLGINYIDYLTECRIEKAKQLMADPDKSLKEITFEVGYRNPNYFSKVFRKTCGCSPTEFRKALLQGKKA